MLRSSEPLTTLPAKAGVGYKPCHFDGIAANPGPVAWFEIHAENYMGDGGKPHAELRTLREKYAISCHGVGLSIGSEGPLDKDHLARLKHLVGWLEPASFSEHLAWSTHDTGYYNDLLPVPYTQKTADVVVAHINQVQDTVNRRMLLENPSSYVAFAQSTLTEIEFLNEIVARTGCGLLLDVNNVFVSGTNQQTNPEDYIDNFPVQHIGELHLGGHGVDADENGDTLLIDNHACEVVDPVWALYRRLLGRTGPLPTLIEWDNDIPDWAGLSAQAGLADAILKSFRKAA